MSKKTVPLISVIIPTYNRRYCIARALGAVLGQTYQNRECIVVDDGSTDGTASFIKGHYPQVNLIQQTQRGVSYARNIGIQAAHGEWLALLDSDDSWHPEKLQQQVDALQASPNYLACHTNEIWIRNGRRVNPKKKYEKRGGDLFLDCLPLCCIAPSSVLLHKKIFHHIGLFDISLPACEDYDLWLRLTAHYPVLYLPNLLTIKYGGHHDQLSRHYWGMDRFRIKALEKILAMGSLDQKKQHAVYAVLEKKRKIFLSGQKKRGYQVSMVKEN